MLRTAFIKTWNGQRPRRIDAPHYNARPVTVGVDVKYPEFTSHIVLIVDRDGSWQVVVDDLIHARGNPRG